MIWFKDYTIKELNKISENTMVSHLGMVFTEIGEDFLKMQMPVDNRTIQPAGILHGGASVAMAETIGSVGAYLTIDPVQSQCVGLEINTNHIKSVADGKVVGVGKPIHIGRSTQIWEVRITNEEGKLCAISRITLAVLDLKQ